MSLPHFRRLSVTFGLLTLVLSGVLGLRAGSIYAHARYERSDPPADAVIPEAPPEIHVWFTQELFRREGANDLRVYGPGGTRVDEGDARIDDDDRTHMIVSLQPGLPAGTYTVEWETLSAEDGDEDSGEFSFTVSPASEGGTPPASEIGTAQAATPTETPTTPPPTASPTPMPTTPVPSSTPAPDGGALACLSGLLVGGLATVGMLWGRSRAGWKRDV